MGGMAGSRLWGNHGLRATFKVVCAGEEHQIKLESHGFQYASVVFGAAIDSAKIIEVAMPFLFIHAQMQAGRLPFDSQWLGRLCCLCRCTLRCSLPTSNAPRSWLLPLPLLPPLLLLRQFPPWTWLHCP